MCQRTVLLIILVAATQATSASESVSALPPLSQVWQSENMGRRSPSTRGLSTAESASQILSGRLRTAQRMRDEELPAPTPADGAAGPSTPRTPVGPLEPTAPARDLLPGQPGGGGFPQLPHDPSGGQTPLLPLHVELYEHGGSYLYVPEGDRLGWPDKHSGEHFETPRLPEDYVAPEPFTLFADFLGADPILPTRHLRYPGCDGFGFEPRFVGYGAYSVFHSFVEQGGQEVHGIGHNAIVDLDLRLTGTERFHVQFRPLGEGNTGGSVYLFDPDRGYVDNSNLEPARYWVEGALDSIFGGWLSDFRAFDYNFVAGKFPLQLHNNLLMNDEILGVVLAKNTIYLGNLSNLNWQAFYGFNDVDVSADGEGQLLGTHLQWEYRSWLFEGTYAHVNHDRDPRQDADWAAISGTNYHGPWALTGRALVKWGDEGGLGNGTLFTLEANRLVAFKHPLWGVDHAVLFANGFAASRGWESIARANFNRIRTAFEVNPLTQIAVGGPLQRDTVGASVGGQFFWDHDDQSVIPELAFEAPSGEPVFGVGVRYLRKVGERSVWEVLSLTNFSDDPQFDRRGIFSSWTILF